ncbi:hypothetical protein [Bradyrhizobium sp. USDA 223]|uniref:hypothetical protein n=1 Tax=Bradyrhizobium sp. USDA 223 TaxID=3156306 RepID=UPI00383934CE
MMLSIDGVGGRGRGQGAPVNVLAKLMKVDPSFVTAQSELLERKRLLRYQARQAGSPGHTPFIGRRRQQTSRDYRREAGKARSVRFWRLCCSAGVQAGQQT